MRVNRWKVYAHICSAALGQWHLGVAGVLVPFGLEFDSGPYALRGLPRPAVLALERNQKKVYAQYFIDGYFAFHECFPGYLLMSLVYYFTLIVFITVNCIPIKEIIKILLT